MDAVRYALVPIYLILIPIIEEVPDVIDRLMKEREASACRTKKLRKNAIACRLK